MTQTVAAKKDSQRDPARAPTVAVCVPVRNGERLLPHTLTNLLLHSSYPEKRFEVWVADHGSTDGTAAILREFSARFANLRSIQVEFTEPNRPLARNRLIAASDSEIVIFLDQDVLVNRDFIWQHVEAHATLPHALVAGHTFGKDFFGREVEHLLSTLDLNDIDRSAALLRSHPDMGDVRTRPHMLGTLGEPLHDITDEAAAFRFCWSCNLSARRADIRACGTFDERYTGWGIEDDDFAEQFRQAGRRLLFSTAAWAFHLPHPMDSQASASTWRKNFEQFLRKFRSREIEYYSMFGQELAVAAQGPESTIGYLTSVLPAAQLPEPPPPSGGRRLQHFVTDTATAKRFGLTDALNPCLPLRAAPKSEDGVTFWPVLGFRTGFEEHEIDETLIHTDHFMLIDRHFQVLLLEEAARISKHVQIVRGPRFSDPKFAFSARTLHEIIDRLKFQQLSWC